MAFALDPAASVPNEVIGVARHRIDKALTILADLDEDAESIEQGVHRTRKRCKEARATARLVRSDLGDDFGPFNASVRDAALALGTIRDAHATLATFDTLLERRGRRGDSDLVTVRTALARAAEEATRSVRRSDPRLETARSKLEQSRQLIDRWHISDDVAVLAAGLEDTVRRGRKALERARREPTDERIHEWRKATKTLWYQTRLLEQAAPSVLTPAIASLDALANALGDDHDLAVLVERLRHDPDGFGGVAAVGSAVDLARAGQDDLRRRAFRLGGTVFAERPRAFARRLARYWRVAGADGPELTAGGIADLDESAPANDGTPAVGSASADDGTPAVGSASADDDTPAVGSDEPAVVERERKFLVAVAPELPDDGVALRQGYVAIDGDVAVRVRDAGGDHHTLTLKAGGGAVRTELEWSIEPAEFDAAWDHTAHRRIHKTRYRLPLGEHTAELDVFHDELDGLVLVEVEFDDDEAMAAFDPPDWFGREVTDDPIYTNASLAVAGLDVTLLQPPPPS